MNSIGWDIEALQEIWQIEERKSPNQNSKKKSKFENDKQNCNTFLPISRHAAQSYAKLIDTSKYARHDTALQRNKISSIHQNRGRSPCSKGNLQKGLAKPTHGGADSTIKRNYDLPTCRKETKKKKTHTLYIKQNEKAEKDVADIRTW